MSRSARDTFTTYTGRTVHVLAPRPEDIDLEDIARALSRSQRFAGHAHRPISIAEHSVTVSRLCRPENALLGLLHDATEAFTQDVISPLKAQLPTYKAIELKWALAIGEHFGLGGDLASLPEDVHHADAVALQIERRDCFEPARVDPKGPEPDDRFRSRGLSAQKAYRTFLSRFSALSRT